MVEAKALGENGVLAPRPALSRLGDIAELQASVWLMGQGYDVFRNLSCVGPVDLVARNRATGAMLAVDVKSVNSIPYRRRDGAVCLPLFRHPREGVHVLAVVHGKIYGFVRSTKNPARGEPSYELYEPEEA